MHLMGIGNADTLDETPHLGLARAESILAKASDVKRLQMPRQQSLGIEPALPVQGFVDIAIEPTLQQVKTLRPNTAT
jgi:hypothetical protein